MRLEMSFPNSNALIDKFTNIFCGWGQIKTPKDSTGNIRGKINAHFNFFCLNLIYYKKFNYN